MTPDLRESAATIAAALVHVEQSAGAEASGEAAELMISLASAFIFHRIGPAAARTKLATVWAQIDAEIEAQNCGSSALS
jgi:hypothetical protein